MHRLILYCTQKKSRFPKFIKLRVYIPHKINNCDYHIDEQSWISTATVVLFIDNDGAQIWIIL